MPAAINPQNPGNRPVIDQNPPIFIAGAGTMGLGIAQAFAIHGRQTFIYALNSDRPSPSAPAARPILARPPGRPGWPDRPKRLSPSSL